MNEMDDRFILSKITSHIIIIMIHTCDCNNHLYYNLYCATKWPFPRCRELDFGLELDRNGFEERFIFIEGPCKPIRDDEVIGVAGGDLFFELNI